MRGADSIARQRDRLERQIEQLVRYEWQLPIRDFQASELDFGDPVPVRLDSDNGAVYVRGAIDRVDRLASGELTVRDLKTGRVRALNEDPINATRDLQIGLYIMALEAMMKESANQTARVASAAYVHPSEAQEPERGFSGPALDQLRRQTRDWLGIARQLLSSGSFPRTPNAEDCLYCPFVPACGDGAQQRSAAKLDRLRAGHVLEPFARFKREADEEDGDG